MNTPADREAVIAKIEKRIKGDSDPVELADMAEEVFLSETGRKVVPQKAFWVWVALAVAMEKGDSNSGQDDRLVSSVKRGDTTINYSSEAGANDAVSGIMARVRAFRIAKTK